jgi:hypothetical protein
MNALAATGLPIYITEMDLDGETDQVQLDEMMRLFPLFWEHPAVAGVTFFGFRPPVWRQAQGAYLTWTNGVERPALQWLRDYVIASNPPLRPMLTAQPTSVATPALQTVTFTLEVNANPAPAIQWQQSADGGATWSNVIDGGGFSGANTSALSIVAAPYALNQARFRAIATNASGTIATRAVALTVSRLPATIALGALEQLYDGAPRIVSAGTSPAGLPVSIAYDGSPTPPIYPGSYAVAATLADDNYSGIATAVLHVDIAALVRHAPSLNGGIDGSIQLVTAENIALEGGAWVSGNLLVPGMPALRLNGHPTLAGTIDGPGEAAPTTHAVTLNGNSVLRYVVRRIDPMAVPLVDQPPQPVGTRSVSLNQPGESAGDFATLRHLSLNGNAGMVAVTAGTYGNFSASGASGFVLGEAGATEPSTYHLQSLTLNGGSRVEIVGPVIVVLAGGLSLNNVTFSDHPVEWLMLKLASGGLTLNGGVRLPGSVIAPSGTVTLNGSSTLRGTIKADRLIVNGNATLESP